MSTKDLEASMRKSVEATQRNFNTIRTGRANSSLLDRITVEYYGADTPLKSLATLTTPDSQTIQIQPFDLSSLGLIEKAIAMSELGFTPNNDGKIIRINVPPLTEERRKEFCKLASKYAEEGKVALRNLRRTPPPGFSPDAGSLCDGYMAPPLPALRWRSAPGWEHQPSQARPGG